MPVKWIQQIFRLEEKLSDRPPDERLALRKEHSLPLLDSFDAWSGEHAKTMGKTGKLTEAVPESA